jgi:hypothetical protein
MSFVQIQMTNCAVIARESGRSGIPEASRSSTTASGILGRPVKPDDDIE